MNQSVYIACCHCCFYRSDGFCYKTNRNRKVMDAPCQFFQNGQIVLSEISSAITVSFTSTATGTLEDSRIQIEDSLLTFCESKRKGHNSAKEESSLTKNKDAPKNEPRCISCGKKLEIKVRGRDRYCGKCGCFLPECVYDQRFTDLVKDVNPMKIIRPSALPTAKCRG